MITKMQQSFGAGELSPGLWGRTDLAKFSVGAKKLRNVIVHAQGGASNRAGTKYVGTVPTEVRFIPFEFNAAQTYVLAFGERKMWILKDGGLVVYPSGPNAGQVVVITTSYSVAQAKALTFCQSADTLFICHPTEPPRKLVRGLDHHLWTFADLVFDPTILAPTGLTVTPAASSKQSYTYRVACAVEDGSGGYWYGEKSSPVQVSVPDPFVGTVPLTWEDAAYTYYVVFRNGAAIAAVSATSYTDNGTTNSFSSSENLVAVPVAAAGLIAVWSPAEGADREYQYAVSALSAEGESFPCAGVTGAFTNPWPAGGRIIVSWDDVADAAGYMVYKNSRGQWGWIGQTDATTTLFNDDNVDPDITFAPRGDNIIPFGGGYNEYPAAVSLYQQRLVFARTNEEPTNIWASRIGDLFDFSISDPLRSDDPLLARPASGKVDEIRHLVPAESLILLTAGAEWIMRGSNGAVTNSNIEFVTQSYYGSAGAELPPITSGKSVLFVQRGQQKIRNLQYAFEVDGYKGTDLTILAGHLFQGKTIVSWSYQQNPDGLIWAVLSDGTLATMTYLPDHDVYAWSRHDTDGLVKSIGGALSDTGNEHYICVARTIGGSTVYMIENLAVRDTDITDGIFLDSAITATPVAKVVSGLSHLEGKTVTAVADSKVIKDLVVSGGQITLPITATVANVGLPYTSQWETLSFDLADNTGSNQGRRQRVAGLTLRLRDTRSLWAGPDEDSLSPLAFRTTEQWSVATQLFSGDYQVNITPQWNSNPSIFLQNDEPSPVTVSAIIPEVDIGD